MSVQFFDQHELWFFYFRLPRLKFEVKWASNSRRILLWVSWQLIFHRPSPINQVLSTHDTVCFRYPLTSSYEWLWASIQSKPLSDVSVVMIDVTSWSVSLGMRMGLKDQIDYCIVLCSKICLWILLLAYSLTHSIFMATVDKQIRFDVRRLHKVNLPTVLRVWFWLSAVV